MKTILGTLRDIKPNAPYPTLELTFSSSDHASLPPHHGDELLLSHNETTWTGTIGLTPTNKPYVHTFLHSGGDRRSCTEFFLPMGLAEGAMLRFRVVERGVLELTEIVTPGEWRPGGNPNERSSRISPRPAIPRKKPAPAPRDIPPFPFDDSEAVHRYADLYWSKITSKERAEEMAFEQELPAFRQRQKLDKPIFVRIARWKSVRKTPDYESNSDESIREATRRAFAATTDKDALAALTILRGVAVRTATALLHWMVPSCYPILDVRVLSALGETEPSSFEDPAFYTRIADRIRELASKLDVDLRSLDRALWTWDKVGGNE